ncbi:MAG TPA: FAD-binding oxidoreductase, partial [Ktedonobacteraceae bacterium]
MGRLSWQIGKVVTIRPETTRTRSNTLALLNWIRHRAGQHVDGRLTAEDGYQAERSYSIASPPEEAPRVTLTVERLDDGEVSPYLTKELRVGDQLELRGPIGGYARLGGAPRRSASAGRRRIRHRALDGDATPPSSHEQH